METNQKSMRKKVLGTAALVVCLATILFLWVKVYQLEETINTCLMECEGEVLNAPVSQTNEQVQADTTKTDIESGEAVEPAWTQALEVDRPQDITAVESQAKYKVYLTFDDGPSKNTEEILDILDEYGVKATFFVIGKEDEEAQKRLQMIYERGHTIGMHSYSHDYSVIYDSVDAFRDDFLKSKKYIFDATGVETTHFRFPGGSSNKLGKLSMTEFVAILEEQGVEYYDWNVSSGDGGSHLVPVDVLLENCTSTISRYETSIILMHDSAAKTTTVEALPQILETILAMEDTQILPITENTQPVHHAIKTKKTEESKEEKEEPKESTEKKEEKEEKEEDPKKSSKDEEKKETKESKPEGETKKQEEPKESLEDFTADKEELKEKEQDNKQQGE